MRPPSSSPAGARALTARDHLVLERVEAIRREHALGTTADPVLLEVFNNLFMAIAEQMGVTLANTSYSVNIKERLDFSCAIFDAQGSLIANAPHMPVHLGSMGESVRTIIDRRTGTMRPGDVFVLNAPYNGGTHLPDVTVIAPVFLGEGTGGAPEFFVASRGHHADIGGITPGSMPPDSSHVDEEGVLLDNVVLVAQGRFLEAEMRAILASGRYPARNPDQNIADLRAQVAACAKGADELAKMVAHFSLPVVRAYMQHVQDNAEASVRRVLGALKDGSFSYEMDNGAVIRVAIRVDREAREATIDFTGTSPQQPTNFNAPSAVCKAAVLYVFRTLVDDEIPMNAGCLKPLTIVIPEGSMLSPRYPAAVVAGNVETSQAITDCLYGALGVLAASQGTMNNFTFGNDRYQYYETISGGSGAGPDFDGTSVVQTHMTNSRLTDPEVLEWRFPVRLESYAIRRGSGGAGRHRGGDGGDRRVRFLEPMTAVMLANHRRVAPFGLDGGQPGATGRNWVERAEGTREDLRRDVQGRHGRRRRHRDPDAGGRGVRTRGRLRIERDDARVGSGRGDDELGDRDGKAKAPWPGAARVDVEHAIASVDPGLVRMAAHDDLHAGRGRLDVEVREIVHDVDEHAREFDELDGAEPVRPRPLVVVAADGRERCDVAQCQENGRRPDVTAVHDVVAPCQGPLRLRAQESMRVRDEADAQGALGGASSPLRQRNELGLPGHRREALRPPVLFRPLDALARARDEVPPQEALAVERVAADQHQPRVRARAQRGRHAGIEHGHVRGRQQGAVERDLAVDEIDRAFGVVGGDDEARAGSELDRGVQRAREHRRGRGGAEEVAGDDRDARAGRRQHRHGLAGDVHEGGRRLLVRSGQRDPGLQQVQPRAARAVLGAAALGVHDAAPGRHPVDRARLDRLREAEAVAVDERAFVDPGHGRQPDVGVGADVEAAAGRQGDGTRVVEEDEGSRRPGAPARAAAGGPRSRRRDRAAGGRAGGAWPGARKGVRAS